MLESSRNVCYLLYLYVYIDIFKRMNFFIKCLKIGKGIKLKIFYILLLCVLLVYFCFRSY